MTSEFDARVREWRADLESALRGLYGDRADELGTALIEAARRANEERDPELLGLDRRRAVSPFWYQDRRRVGYMAYADRFGGDLAGVRRRIPYLTELGVDVLHLLSLLQPRDGENDGGYAIRDYGVPDARLGTAADLVELIGDLRSNGIGLCVDFVLNHTSDDHDWAVAARAGSGYHRSLYRTFADRTEPDAWEATLPEVFPNLAPANFTWDAKMERWVWTTFRDFQWDLDWSNPDVMREVFDLALHLANLGVEILRLDAIAFTWKRLGTNCQNLPEAHLIAQALRAALAMAAPATLLLAEAIVGPDDLVAYVGRHERERRECELGYHNQLMVQCWSMVASRRADLARHALARLPDPPPRATWFTYVRCHDDIGWAIDDADAARVGFSGAGHREFLAAFFRGEFWQSFARGRPFGVNVETNDERTSGMTSTLAGVAAALDDDDPVALDRAVRRMLLLYGIVFGYGGIPIIYMGDELCQGDDRSYLDDPDRVGRQPMDPPARCSTRNEPRNGTIRRPSPAASGQGLRHLIETRKRCNPLHDDGATVRTFDAGSPAVFAWHRDHPRFGEMIGLANVGDERRRRHPASRSRHPARSTSSPPTIAIRGVSRRSQVRWITADRDYATLPATAPPS